MALNESFYKSRRLFAADFWFCATRIVENVEFEMTSAIPDNFLFSTIEHAGEKCTNMFCKALQGKGLNLHKTKRVLNKFHAAEINQKTSRNLFLLALWCSIEFFPVLLASSLCCQHFIYFLFCTVEKHASARDTSFQSYNHKSQFESSLYTQLSLNSNWSSFLFVAIFASFSKTTFLCFFFLHKPGHQGRKTEKSDFFKIHYMQACLAVFLF